MKTYSNFTQAYVSLLKDVYTTPEHVAAPRGLKIKEKLGHSFRITNIRDRLPYVPHRDFSISYCIAELIWYLSGNDETEWIANYAGFWRGISDDGVTANSAYGGRIFKQHDYQKFFECQPHAVGGMVVGAGITKSIPKSWTQWQYLKDELKNDPDSRRAVIHIRMPQDSFLAQKDVPCTLTLQFFIRDNALHQVASMRSSDLILGLAYDVPAFTIFQEMLANELQVECGSYTHISNSMHIYEKNFEQVERILRDPWVKELPHRCQPMPVMTSLPPMNALIHHEKMLRRAGNELELAYSVEQFNSIETYWRDWLLILASHRAGKLGLDELQQKLVQSTEFKGYSVFKR